MSVGFSIHNSTAVIARQVFHLSSFLLCQMLYHADLKRISFLYLIITEKSFWKSDHWNGAEDLEIIISIARLTILGIIRLVKSIQISI